MKNVTYFTSKDVISALKSINRMSCSLTNAGSDGAKLPVVLPIGDYIARRDISQKEQEMWFYVLDEECDRQDWYSVAFVKKDEIIIGKN